MRPEELRRKCESACRNIENLIEARKKLNANYFILLSERSGSTPQFEGAYILINTETGEFIGTVGGGLIEYKCISMAKDLAQENLSARVLYTLNNKEASDLGMVCGGRNLIYILPCNKNEELFRLPDINLSQLGDDELEKLYVENLLKYINTTLACECLDKGETYKSIYDKYSSDASKLELYKDGPHFANVFDSSLEEEDLREAPREENISDISIGSKEAPLKELRDELVELNKSCNVEILSKKVFVFMAETEPRVIIAGGGHVSRAVSSLLGQLGWNHIILEDRDEILKEEFFSPLAALWKVDLENLPDELCLGDNDYVCIMTRGHMHDYIVLKQVLRKGARYIGVMGSKRKLTTVRSKLAEDGFTDSEINSIYSPIGLDISAVSLMEIAISVVAEIIAVHRKQIHINENEKTYGRGLKDSVGIHLPIRKKDKSR